MCDPLYHPYNNLVGQLVEQPIDSWTFKSNPTYREILEHVNLRYGQQYLQLVMDEFLSTIPLDILVQTCQENDTYGAPLKHAFDGFIQCSPTSLRYLYHSLLILQFLAKCGQRSVNIVEIGGGYGGLCLFLHRAGRALWCPHFIVHHIRYSQRV